MKYLNINHHKKIIDLSQRHLIPARIKEYAFHIYDRFSKYQPCNRDEQLCKFLLYFAERKLRSAPANSSYFLKTNAEEEKRQGLEALRNGKKNWYSIRTPVGYRVEFLPEDRMLKLRYSQFPFFSTYLVDNGLEDDLLALKELRAGEPEVALLSPEYEFNLKNTLEWKYDNFILKNDLFQLCNDDILDDLGDRETLRPVFVTDHPSAA